MYAIRQQSTARAISFLLTLCLVSTLIPVGVVNAAADGVSSVLVFSVLDESGSGVEDLGSRATNAVEMAINGQPEYSASSFSRHSALVRRAVSEGRLRQVDVEAAEVASHSLALFIGNVLGFDYVAIASIQSFEMEPEPRQANVILAGQMYAVKGNVDEATGEVVDEPTVFRAFGVKGSSRPRAQYVGSDNPLIGEALRDAGHKAALTLAGKPLEELVTVDKESSKWKWVLYALAIGALMIGVNNAGSSPAAAGPADQVKPVTNLYLQPLQANIRLIWNEPTATTLEVLQYEVSRSVDGGGFSLLATGLGPGTSQYTDINTLAGRHVYQYRVRVLYANGQASGYALSGALAHTRD